MRTAKGFTLIELVVVIVILGILAVTAAPRFLNIQGDARVAVIEGVRGAVVNANQIANAKYQLGYGVSIGSTATDNTFLDLNKNGAQDDGEPLMVWGHLDNVSVEEMVNLDGDLVVSDPEAPGKNKLYIGFAQNADALENSQCYFLYTQASGEGTEPSFETVISGC
ncbi:prepilin-type N-terminal cleavage/methylation domain-containing protein [Vibrio jasicida]|uniref:prepilin-type N-terminal cleavage/methylation domain-containing protein n=1 Tax=Vibrio jasicida TaxID=766224 RepID=UPI0005EE61CD|nr:type II secretion system protein [Vibrio jasicida]